MKWSKAVLSLLRMFWGVCLLRVPPQDIPASQALMVMTVLSYFTINLIVALIQLAPHLAMPAALLDVVFLSAMALVVLWVRSLSARFTQTLTALTGSGAILIAIALPLLVWQQQLTAGNAEAGFTLPSLLLLLWTAWTIVVIGHVLRHALSTLFAIGIVLAVVYMHLASQLARVLFLT